MTKKETNKNSFDLQEALTELPYADFVKRAFIKTVDVSKIKNQNDLEKTFKKYMGE